MLFVVLYCCFFISTVYANRVYNLNYDAVGRQAFLDAHNKYRRLEYAADMQELVWSNELADIALDWAQRCYIGHRPHHGRSNRAGFRLIGENIWWWQVRRFPNADSVMKAFYDEVRWYNFDANYCAGPNCGHYKQLVYSKSCTVGCGVVLCDRLYNAPQGWSMVAVCNYGPAGNMRQQPYTRGSPCSACPGECRNGLCANRCYRQSPLASILNNKAPPMSPFEQPKRAMEYDEIINNDPECKDMHESCKVWADDGNCEKNKGYMGHQCRKSCGTGPCRMNGNAVSDENTAVNEESQANYQVGES